MLHRSHAFVSSPTDLDRSLVQHSLNAHSLTLLQHFRSENGLCLAIQSQLDAAAFKERHAEPKHPNGEDKDSGKALQIRFRRVKRADFVFVDFSNRKIGYRSLPSVLILPVSRFLHRAGDLVSGFCMSRHFVRPGTS